jgi:2-iminobutanoate/2-iminopropanoate deaminase
VSRSWKKEIVRVPETKLPAPRIRSTAPAIRVGPLLFVTGQSGRNLGGEDAYSADPAEQARRTMENIRVILEQAGTSFENVVKRTIFVKDPALYDQMRPVIDGYFPSPVASTTVQTGFLRDKMIEVEVIALVPDDQGRR